MLTAMLVAASPIGTGFASSQSAAAQGETGMLRGPFSEDKLQSVAHIVALEDTVVRSIAGDVTDLQDGEWEGREWVYLAVNHEVLVGPGTNSSSQAVVLAHRPGQALEDLDFRLSRQSKLALLALRDAMARGGQEPWTILDLTLERDGRYAFAFRYDPPPRLNGDLLHRPLDDLLARYSADKGLQ